MHKYAQTLIKRRREKQQQATLLPALALLAMILLYALIEGTIGMGAA